ncbi:MAG: AraC family transcriptional regulator [Bacteroidota bacterium]
MEYPEQFKSSKGLITEQAHQGDFFFGSGKYQIMYFEGFHIAYGQLDLIHQPTIHFQSDIEVVEMHFALKGENVTRSDYKQEFVFNTNQHNIVYSDGFSGTSEWLGIPDMQIFEVKLLPSFFKKYLPDERAFLSFRQAIERKQAACLSSHNYPITASMMYCIREIIFCKRQGGFKRLFLEAKVIELLMLQLEQISICSGEQRSQMKKADVEKMYAVKEMLEKNLTTTCKLIDLARLVGTNEFTLKKGFKEIFGTTVFGYWHALKMIEAKRMLEEQGLSVSVVAERVGYQYPQHFSTAFKKYFGIRPSQTKS